MLRRRGERYHAPARFAYAPPECAGGASTGRPRRLPKARRPRRLPKARRPRRLPKARRPRRLPKARRSAGVSRRPPGLSPVRALSPRSPAGTTAPFPTSKDSTPEIWSITLSCRSASGAPAARINLVGRGSFAPRERARPVMPRPSDSPARSTTSARLETTATGRTSAAREARALPDRHAAATPTAPRVSAAIHLASPRHASRKGAATSGASA
jgi:hypothetical protein